MKTLLQGLFLVGLFLISCSEDEISVTITGMDATEGYPYQYVRIQLENPTSTKFDVFFNDKPSRFNATGGSTGFQDGVLAEVPVFTSEEDVVVTLKAGGKVFTVPGSFKVKELPKITHVSSTKCAFRIPIKIVVKNLAYYSSNGSINFNFCETPSICFAPYAAVTIQGDTIIARPAQTYINTTVYTKQNTIKITGNTPPKSSELASGTLTGSTQIVFRPSYSFNTFTGKPGDKFSVVFDNALYFPDKMTLKLGDITIAPSTFDIVGGSGYTNALTASYTIPAGMAAGPYTISITDPNNMEYLPEKGTTFTIQ